jgi:predicted metal-binding protein
VSAGRKKQRGRGRIEGCPGWRFFKLLKDSEELLHEHTNVSIFAFVICLMAIKSK